MMVFFTGFSEESLGFLEQVRANNSKSWFEAHRTRFEQVLLEPFRALVSELTPAVLCIDADIEVRPTVNKTISRIFRDTRFSNDKSLFRDTMWLVFKRPGKEWTVSIPGFYFELSPRAYRYGMGFYTAAPAVMAAFRRKIDADPDAFADVIGFMNTDARYSLEGETYSRSMAGGQPPEINKWYQMKSFYLTCNCTPDAALFSEKLVEELRDGFLLAAPLYRYLVEIEP
jgi:uncharacterized protein (TIGR02453 family)